MNERYSVRISSHTKNHYFKDLEKKYSKRVRDDLEESVVATIQNPQTAFGKEQIETITHQEGKIIGKLRLAIPSQNISKRKGPRAIVLVDKNKQASWLLLIYTKDNVKGSHETAWWKGEIKAAYPKLKDLL